jgi:hypothetical protein
VPTDSTFMRAEIVGSLKAARLALTSSDDEAYAFN